MYGLVSERNVLTISAGGERGVIFRSTVAEGFTFSTEIRHSVQLTPVYEYFRVDDSGGIELTGTRLRDLGWGMPSTETSPVRMEKGFIIFENIGRRLPELRFRVSHIAEPFLVLGERRIDLRRHFADGELMTVGIEKISLLRVLFGGGKDVF